MANVSDLKQLPFANYDLAVYFGIGILSLPFAKTYVAQPLGLQFPGSALEFRSPFVDSAIEALVALFAGYAIGHVIAFLSSYFVEGFIHKWLRYPSDVWLSICKSPRQRQGRVIYTNIASVKLTRASVVSAIFHIPLYPWYAVVHATGFFGFYTPKALPELLVHIKRRMSELGFDVAINHGSYWAKILEHYVANNCPQGYARLYNYLVIFGVLRSLSLLAILYTWVALLKLVIQGSHDASGKIVALSWSSEIGWTPLASYFVLSLFSTFTVMGFAKFNRRFFEEAVYAFVLSGPSKPLRG